MSGSDCGNVFLWDKETQDIVQYMKGDETGVVSRDGVLSNLYPKDHQSTSIF